MISLNSHYFISSHLTLYNKTKQTSFSCLLAIVKEMEEKRKLKKMKVRTEHGITGFDEDRDDGLDFQLSPIKGKKVGNGRDDDPPTRKSVLLELFTKTGPAKVQV